MNLLRVSIVMLVLLCVIVFLTIKVISTNEARSVNAKIDEIRDEVIYDTRFYFRGNSLLNSKVCELRKSVLDLWDKNSTAIKITINDSVQIDSSQCLMLRYYIDNTEHNFFLDDYLYSNMQDNYEIILQYSYDSNYIIQVKDAYVDWNHGTFYPGLVSIVDRSNFEPVATLNLAPPNTEISAAYQRIVGDSYGSTWEPMSMRIIGNPDASDFNYDNSEKIDMIGTNYRRILISIDRGQPEITHYISNLWNKYKSTVVLPFIGLDIILSLFMSLIVFYREKNTYDLINYQKKTTDAMAHDLKTPLAISYIYYEKLKEDRNSDKADAYFDQMKNNFDYMNELINNILVFSKTQNADYQLNRTKTNIRQECDSLLDTLTPAINRRNLTCKIDGDAELLVDKPLWNQAIGNLIINAINHSAPDSSIDISINKDGFLIKNKVDNDIDNPEELVQPFVKGNTSRGENSGSGLGLAVANDNLKRMGFTLRVTCIDKTFAVQVTRSSNGLQLSGEIKTAIVIVLVVIQLLSLGLLVGIRKPDTYKFRNSRYEFAVNQSDEDMFNTMVASFPNEINSYSDLQLRSRVVANIHRGENVMFYVATHYPNVYANLNITTHKDSFSAIRDRDIIVTKAFFSRLEPYFLGNVGTAVIMNSTRYNIWGEASSTDPNDNDINVSCWANLSTFFKLAKKYDHVILQYDKPLASDELKLLKDYMFAECKATQYIEQKSGITYDFLNYKVALFVIINISIIACYVWIIYRKKMIAKGVS